MACPMFEIASPGFCVVVHDVTPVFAREIDVICERLLPAVGSAFAMAAVPCWHAVEPDECGRRKLRDWTSLCGETLLHGWTHRRDYRPRIVSWVTDRADEFGGCSRQEVIERVGRGRSLLEQYIGEPVSGLVPPAWRMPVSIAELGGCGIEYVLNFARLESATGGILPLASFSWDWGRFAFLSRPGASLGQCLCLWNRPAVPIIVVHPADVGRGHLPSALRLLRRLKRAGGVPMLIRDLVPPIDMQARA
jgi:hypothetical protein